MEKINLTPTINEPQSPRSAFGYGLANHDLDGQAHQMEHAGAAGFVVGDNRMTETNEKLTDMNLFNMGLKQQAETWWGKKIEANAETVRSGSLGKCKTEWSERSGWGDGVQLPFFVIVFEGKNLIVKATESGVFFQGKGGGWINMVCRKKGI